MLLRLLKSLVLDPRLRAKTSPNSWKYGKRKRAFTATMIFKSPNGLALVYSRELLSERDTDYELSTGKYHSDQINWAV